MRLLSICLNPTLDVSAQADKVVPYKKIRTSTETVEPGGGGINIVRVLATFGQPAELLYLSAGFSGQRLDSELQSLGIKGHRLPTKGETRIAFNVLDRHSGAEYRFVPEGFPVSSDIGDQVLALLESFTPGDGDLVIASGSLPRGMSPRFYGELCQRLAQQGAQFVLDTSGAALQQALAIATKGHPIFLVKPSRSEIESLAGGALDESGILAAAQRLVTDGAAQHVVVSLGEQGAALINSEGISQQSAPQVEVLSAVGAGDSFVAAMCYKLARGASMQQAFRYGVAAGAAAVITPGTQMCRMQDVLRLHQLMDEPVIR